MIINQSIIKFVENATRLGGVSIDTDNDISIKLIEENVFNQMIIILVNDVIIKTL